MKGKPKEKPSSIFNAHDEYLIIGYSNHDNLIGKYTHYFILDDNFYINTVAKEFFSIIPEKDTNFIKVYDDEYVNVFLDPDFELVYQKSLIKDGRIEFNTNIWDTTWLAYCLNRKGIKLTEKLTFSLSNKEHKINYMHGLLDFATDFMNFDKDCDAHYDIFFQEESGQRKRLELEREHFKTIDTDNFEEIIIEDIERYLFKGNKIENFDGKISYITSRKIFLLIDCLFLNENYTTYEFHNGYKSSKIIFENAEHSYSLHFDESD